MDGKSIKYDESRVLETLRPSPRHSVATDEDASQPAKKPRASKPKVKSGCITCKARRVKCDETKPFCLRCKKFGRACDGYVSTPSTPRGLIQLQPRVPSTTLYEPSLSVHVTKDEHQYFGIFADRATVDFCGYFEDALWTRIVLQESHTNPAIRHAAIALGALHKSLDDAPSSVNKVNVVQTLNRRHLEQAVTHYLKAIQLMNQYIAESTSPELRNTLIACLLFVCFESIQGSYASSIQQQYGGLRLLQSYYQGQARPRNTSATPNPLKRKQSKILSRLDEAICDDSEDRVAKPLKIISPMTDTHDTTNYSFAACPTKISNDNSKMITGGTQVEPVDRQDTKWSTHNISIKQQSIPSHVERISERTRKASGTFNEVAAQESSLRKSQIEQVESKSDAKQTEKTQVPRPPLLQRSLPIEDTIAVNFARAHNTGIFFGLPPEIPVLNWDVNGIYCLPIPPSFPSIVSAKLCWDFLMDRCLQLYRNTVYYRTHDLHHQMRLPELENHVTRYLVQISAFEQAIEPLLSAAVSPNGTLINASALVLSLYTRCTRMALSQVTAPGEMTWDRFPEYFHYIVQTCSFIIASEKAANPGRPHKRFIFDSGIVPPLHLTGVKCRDATLRRQAINLLITSPRQEGLWDGLVSAGVGKWLVECEEECYARLSSHETVHAIKPSNTSTQVSRVSETTNPALYHFSSGRSSQSPPQQDQTTLNLPRRHKPQDSMGLDPSQQPRDAPSPFRDCSSPSSVTPNPLPFHPDIPEYCRFQVTKASLHMPDRYMTVKGQQILPGPDGVREEREITLHW